MKKSQEDLGETLCDYCPLEESQKGVHCYGGQPIMCYDSGHCDLAYESYLESDEDLELDEDTDFTANIVDCKINTEYATCIPDVVNVINPINHIYEKDYSELGKLKEFMRQYNLSEDYVVNALKRYLGV
jgi:hypothetical protein